MKPAAAAAGSAASVIAAATATRVNPSAESSSSRSTVMPPMANRGRPHSRGTAARNSRGACRPNDFVLDGKQGPTPR